MFKLDLEKAEKSEIKLPTSIGSLKKWENSSKTSTSASFTRLNSLTMWITRNCVKFLKKWESDHLNCLLRNLHAGQEATVRTRYGTINWFQIVKAVCQGCILSPCLFNLYAEYIMRNAGLDETQTGVKIARKNINNLRGRWHHHYGRKQRETKKPLDLGERWEWKNWLKTQHSKNYDHGIWSHHVM